MNVDQKAFETAQRIVAVVGIFIGEGLPGGLTQLTAKIQVITRDAMREVAKDINDRK